MVRDGFCFWIVDPRDGHNAEHCGRQTGYRMGLDDDGNRVRIYHRWCQEHAARVAARDAEDTD